MYHMIHMTNASTLCGLFQVCVYTGSLSNLPNADTRASCDPCNGCQCRAGTVPGPDGTCDPVSWFLCVPVAVLYMDLKI